MKKNPSPRKQSNISYLLSGLIILSLLSSCAKELTGDLNVKVFSNGGFASGAKVYTQPASKEGTTDQFGSVLLSEIEPGSYEVYAELQNVGSGKEVVKVVENELAQVNIGIVPGLNINLAPQINFILPGIPAEFSPGENVTFSATVTDDKTPVTELTIEWKSDKDGVLNTQKANNDGNVGFTTNTLSANVHTITLTVKDKDGYSQSHIVEVSNNAPAKVELIEAKKIDGKIVLKWNKYPGTDFLQYEVYSSDENCDFEKKKLIATINDINTVSTTDNAPPLSYRACYFVRVLNNVGKSRNSNNLLVDLPGGNLFNFIPHDMLVHPTKEYVYLIDLSGQKLIKYNYGSGEVEKTITVSGTPGFSGIGDTGKGLEIYVPSSEGFVYVYDAETLNLVNAITTGIYTMNALPSENGYILASMAPSPWWDSPIRTYQRSTGIQIDGDGDFERSRMRLVPGKSALIGISTSVSPVDMDYYELDEAGNFVLSVDDLYHGDHPLDPYAFRISNDGSYVITGNEGAVYLANSSMQFKGLLQRGNLNYSDFAFSDDGSIIYAATSNRTSIQIGNYPSLLRSNEILLRGFPVMIERKANKIICVSKKSESDIVTGIEVIDL